MIVGYARVSTTDQCLDVQIDELAGHGCERIFQDQASGTSRARAGLVEMLQFVRDGDTIVVSRLDRFARSLTDLFQMLEEMTRKGVAFQCVHQSIDTSSSTGKLTLAILGAVAEFENDIRKERQRAGIAKAKANGVYKGRRAGIDPERVRAMAAQGNAAGKMFFQIRYGSKPLELAKGMNAVEVENLAGLPTIIASIMQAVQAGELDTQAKAAIADRKVQRKAKQTAA